jgi:DNA-binding LacI/PurR family transcriptional regulator
LDRSKRIFWRERGVKREFERSKSTALVYNGGMNTADARPTLEHVAREAGVSRGTVSNVFTHPERVRPEVRGKVEAAAARLGYAGPDPRGRMLRGDKYNALGFVVPGAIGIANLLASPYGRELVIGIAEACDAAQHTLTIIDGREPQLDIALRDALVDGFVVGTVGHLAAVEPARRRRIPFAILDVPAGPEINSVSIDATGGARAAAEHLASLGHKRFAILSVRRPPGPPITHPANPSPFLSAGYELDRDKLGGYAAGLAAHGLSIADVPIVETQPVDPTAGSAILAAAPDATAILCMSDRQAQTVLSECARRGIRVPEDLSVVGFDGVPESASWSPPLTTVAQPTRQKGKLAAELVLGGAPPRQLVLPVELIVRKSTGAPPRR